MSLKARDERVLRLSSGSNEDFGASFHGSEARLSAVDEVFRE